MTTEDLLAGVEDIARQAGRVVMEVYATEFEIRAKGDASPVTVADQRAETLIVAALQALTPDIPIVAEEAIAASKVPAVAERFWLVDPLDGTREFIDRNGEFTVNIALVEHGVACLGVVLAPALQRLYSGAVGRGAWVEHAGGRSAIRCRRPPTQGLTVVASRSHADMDALHAHLAGAEVSSWRRVGSSLKLCLVAEGEADIYPRLGRTMEWDIAAAQSVLCAAGGSVTDLHGAPLRYGKPGFENPAFVARGLDAPGEDPHRPSRDQRAWPGINKDS